MPSLELRLRGYPVAIIDGRPAPLALKRGLALLAVLAELGRKVPRQQLSALLWPDAAAAVGRARLRRLVHEVNLALGFDAVVGDSDSLWFTAETDVPFSDLERTRRLARAAVTTPAAAQSRAALEDLLSIDAHQMLEGFEFGADTFDDWVSQRRSEQHRLVARALERIGDELVGSGQPLLAGEAAARLVAIDPLSDAGHALLLRALAQRGDLAAVESAYFAFAELLRAELGVRPSPAYEALYEKARQQIMRPAPASGVDVALASHAPPIRFADGDEGTIAYLELGSGPATLVVLFGVWSHVEVAWEEPTIRAILERFARRFRVVLVDRRGVGLSERLAQEHSLAAGAHDLEAVRRAVGAERLWLFGNSLGSMIAIEYAALFPDRVHGLALYGANARGCWSPDYPWALTLTQLDAWAERLREGWGQATSLAEFSPSSAGNPAARDWWARLLRQAMSRNSLPALLRGFARMDVRHRLRDIGVPTLVLQREGDRITRVGAARYLAQQIPGARLMLLPGDDHNLWAGDVEAVIGAVEDFLQG
ncbi:MAG: alpha/beta fold hydrolase [Burkholderiales bacterium]|nr:alpha/beta fold hydrolase [Burkholderiales bacterium]